MKQTKSLLGIIASIFAMAFVMASCKTEISIPNYTVTYSSAHGSVPEAISVKENTALSEDQLPVLSDDNASFAGWYCGNSKVEAGYVVNADLALTARWEFTVTYSSQYGTALEAINVEENSVLSAEQLPELTDDAAVFKGWYAGDTKAVPSEYQITNNVTLTARWSQLATITYHSRFGTVPESFELERNQTLTSEKVTAPADCSPYTFLGWFDSEDDDHNGTGEQINVGLTITNNTDLYAKWKTATVSFTTQYGTNPASIKKYTGEKITETEIPALTARTGYTSDGWFNSSTKLTTDYTVNGDVAFTEKWTVNTYTITFKANGGAGDDYTQTVTYATTAKLNPNTFTREGWSFIEWNKAADGSGTSYSDESNFAVTDANDITLYAQWDPIADATTVADMIKNMTESGTIAVKGSISDDTISKIKSALNILRGNNSNILVSLDLSRTTGITQLKFTAFADCANLKDITIPFGVKSIGKSAFNGCTGLTSIEIPSSVTSIGEYAFYECSGLSGSLTIPSSVTSIGEYAFYKCSGLSGSLTIPSGVTSIGKCAFSGCSGLTGSLTIPSGVKSIGDDAFYKCSGLSGSLTIPSGVTSIGEGAFCGCSGLTGSLTIPSGVTSIGYAAFSGCSGLTGSLTIPSGVTSIGNTAFKGCIGLTSITISLGVTSIGNYAFQDCIGLTSITIPSTVTSIGEYAFQDCSGLSGSLTIPSGVKSIGGAAFYGCTGLTSIEIPSSVTSIGGAAFKGCTGLTSIEIPSSVTSIGYAAFSGCSGLTSITIPSGVTSVGAYAFQDCIGLISITIPSGVTKIGKGAFTSCSKLTGVTFADTTSSWYWTTSEYFTGGTKRGPMSSDATANATLLTKTYSEYYLYKK